MRKGEVSPTRDYEAGYGPVVYRLQKYFYKYNIIISIWEGELPFTLVYKPSYFIKLV